MAYGFGVKTKTPIKTAPAKSGSYGFGAKTITAPSTSQVKTSYLSKDLGGGAYNTVIGQPNTLALSSAKYGLLNDTKKPGQEGHHIIGVAAGGVSIPENFMNVDKELNRRLGVIQTQAMNDYEAGKISLPEVRMRTQIELQKDLLEKQGISDKNINLGGKPGKFADYMVGSVQNLAKTIKNNLFGKKITPTVYTPPTKLITPNAEVAKTPLITTQQKTSATTPMIDREAQGPVSSVFGAVRATTDIATIPITATVNFLSPSDKKVPIKTLINSTIEMARQDAQSGGTASINQAVQNYLQNRKVGKYGGKDVNVLDVMVLSGLGFFNIFGDPILGAGAVIPLAKEAKFALQFRKTGQVVKPLAEGVKIINPVTRTLDLSNDVKMVIKPKSNEVIFQGFIRRGSNGEILRNPLEIEAISSDISSATGKNITPRVVGNDLSLTATTKPAFQVAKETLNKGVALSKTGQTVNSLDPTIKYEIKPVGPDEFGKPAISETNINPVTKEATITISPTVKSPEKIADIINHEHGTIIEHRTGEIAPKSAIQANVDKFVADNIKTKQQIGQDIIKEVQSVGGLDKAVALIKDNPAKAQTLMPTFSGISKTKADTIIKKLTTDKLVAEDLERTTKETEQILAEIKANTPEEIFPVEKPAVEPKQPVEKPSKVAEVAKEAGLEKKADALSKARNEFEKSTSKAKGIYNVKEKQDLYKKIIKPKINKLGKVSKDETIIYYQGSSKNGQYVNTSPSEVWHYDVNKNLAVRKIKTDQLKTTGNKLRDEVGYRLINRPIKSQESPKTVRVWRKSRFSEGGSYVDYKIIRKEENITLYQGGAGGQHWTPDKKYASQFGEVKEKTGSFYQIDNGNRMTNVYVEVPSKEVIKPVVKEVAKSEITDTINAFNIRRKSLEDAGLLPKASDLPGFVNPVEFKKIITESPLVVEARKSLKPLNFQDTETQNIFRQWNGIHILGKESARKEAAKLPILGRENGMRSIFDYESGRPSELGNKIKDVFDKLHSEARQRGLDTAYRQNYIPQVYANTREEVIEAAIKYLQDQQVPDKLAEEFVLGEKDLPEEISNRLKINPSFDKTRVFPDYETAIKYKLTPKYTEPSQLAGYYREEMEKTFANRALLNDLQKAGKLKDFYGAGKDWAPITTNFSSKEFFAAPDLAKMINGMFRNEETLGFGQRLVKKTAGINRVMQEVRLSAGIPGTSVNYFTTSQTIKDVTQGIGALLSGDIKGAVSGFRAIPAYWRSNFNKGSIKYFEKNQTYVDEMAKQGIDLTSRIGKYNKVSLRNIAASKNYGKLLGEGWNRAFGEKTFNSFMPMRILDTYKDTKLQLIAKGLPEDEAIKIAADTAKKFHGLVEKIGRDKTTEDVLGTFFFAPKFREGIINTLANTVKGFGPKNLKNPAFRRNRQLMLGIIVTAILYDQLNRKLNNHSMVDNPAGKEDSLMIPLPNSDIAYMPLLPSFLSIPRSIFGSLSALYKGDVAASSQKISGNFSMGIKTSTEVLSNRDYFGREIYTQTDTGPQKMQKLATYAGLAVNHPYIEIAYKYQQGKIPAYQAWSQALEMPFKYGSEEKLIQSEYYDQVSKNKITKAREKAAFKTKVYDKIMELDGEEYSDAIIALSDNEYKLFMAVKKTETAKATIKAKPAVYAKYKEFQNLMNANKTEEAQTLINNMTDSEYKTFKKIYDSFE